MYGQRLTFCLDNTTPPVNKKRIWGLWPEVAQFNPTLQWKIEWEQERELSVLLNRRPMRSTKQLWTIRWWVRWLQTQEKHYPKASFWEWWDQMKNKDPESKPLSYPSPAALSDLITFTSPLLYLIWHSSHAFRAQLVQAIHWFWWFGGAAGQKCQSYRAPSAEAQSSCSTAQPDSEY